MAKEYGVLMPLFALDNDFSIGSFGSSARKFIDLLSRNKYTWWQVLPLCICDEFNSPYNTASIFSINPFYIDLEILYSEGLITLEQLNEEKSENCGRCNYNRLKRSRMQVLYNAFLNFNEFINLKRFIDNHPDTAKFCKFQALCLHNGTNLWNVWKEMRYDDDTEFFWQFLQYTAFKQWTELKKYAQDKGIKIMGDLPMYSSYCNTHKPSKDNWSYRFVNFKGLEEAFHNLSALTR